MATPKKPSKARPSISQPPTKGTPGQPRPDKPSGTFKPVIPKPTPGQTHPRPGADQPFRPRPPIKGTPVNPDFTPPTARPRPERTGWPRPGRPTTPYNSPGPPTGDPWDYDPGGATRPLPLPGLEGEPPTVIPWPAPRPSPKPGQFNAGGRAVTFNPVSGKLSPRPGIGQKVSVTTKRPRRGNTTMG